MENYFKTLAAALKNSIFSFSILRSFKQCREAIFQQFALMKMALRSASPAFHIPVSKHFKNGKILLCPNRKEAIIEHYFVNVSKPF